MLKVTFQSFYRSKMQEAGAGAPVAFKTCLGHQYMVSIICFPPGIGLRWLTKLGGDQSPCHHAQTRPRGLHIEITSPAILKTVYYLYFSENVLLICAIAWIDTHIVPILELIISESLLKKLVPVLWLSPFHQNMV
jgi:hypothetical protein